MESPRYRFPILRYYTFCAVILVADILSSVLLWAVAGSGSETEIKDSVTHFKVESSVFDFVCINCGRGIILIILFALLESMTISAAQRGVNNKVKRKIIEVIVWLITLGSLGYTIYKDVVVLKKHKDNKHIMKYKEYYALCISSFVFVLIEILMFIKFLFYLRNLHNILYASLMDEESGRSSTDGKPKKKEVNLARLATLMKPVSNQFSNDCVHILLSVR